jgi:collagenase-like PrtC family protease
MKHLSMPADFKLATLDRYAELNARYPHLQVLETYGNLNPSPLVLGTGRITRGLPASDWTGLEKYIAHSRRLGIGFNYTFNASCTGNLEFTAKGVRTLTGFFERLLEIGCDLVTLAAPSLISLVRGTCPRMRVAASTIAEIDTVVAVREFERMGVCRIILNEDILRDFSLMAAMKRAASVPLEAIVNTRCIHVCPFKPFDFNFLSHCGSDAHSRPILDYYKWHCTRILFRNPIEWIKMPWIRPEDLPLYEDVELFKVAGRQLAVDGDPARTAECYMRGRYEGNLVALLGLFAAKRLSFYPVAIDNRKLDGFADWFKRPRACKPNGCSDCDHCATYARAAIDASSVAELERRAALLEQELATFHDTCNPLGLDAEEIAAATRGLA